MRNYEPIWRVKAAAEGRLKAPMRTAKSGGGIDNDQAIAAEAWNRLAEGLSRSDNPEDRVLADHVDRFLSGTFAIDSKRQLEVGPEPQLWRVNLDARGATIWMRTVSRRVDDAAHLIVAGAIHAGGWLSPICALYSGEVSVLYTLASPSRRLQSADRDPRGPIRARGAIYAGG